MREHRLWERVPATGNATLPGLWVACSDPVERTQDCTCQFPLGYVRLPGPWEAARAAVRPWVASGSLYATRTDARGTAPVLISASTTLRPPDRGMSLDSFLSIAHS